MRKKSIVLVVLILLLSSTIAFAASVNGTFAGFPIVKVNLNGEILKPSVPGIVMQGSTLLPVRAIAEGMDAVVTWDQSTMTASITKPNITMNFITDININDDGTWDLLSPYQYSTIGQQGQTLIYYEAGPMETKEYEYRIIARDPNGDILDSTSIEKAEINKYGVRGYLSIEDLVFKSVGIYNFEFQIKYNDEFKTVQTKPMYVE